MNIDEIVSYIKNAGTFDEHWYATRYPDISLLNIDPIGHYVRIGALLHRDPGPDFSTAEYLNLHPDVRAAGINPYFHYLKWGRDERRKTRNQPAPTVRKEVMEAAVPTVEMASVEQQSEAKPIHGATFSVAELDRKLWGGYSRLATEALGRTKGDGSLAKLDRADAAWCLARWFYFHADYPRTMENVQFFNVFHPAIEKKVLLLEIQALIKLERWSDALERIDAGLQELRAKTDLYLLRSTAVRCAGMAAGNPAREVEKEQLALLNEAMAIGKVAGLRLKDPGKPLHFFNLSCKREKTIKSSPKVSIVIPAYNAESTIGVVLDSLTNQTWLDVEIVVVDDVSTDRTVKVVTGIAKKDKRIKLVQQKENGGAYAARNAGLLHATGDYITVHDSDDWSHPRKIELQIAALKDNPGAHACISYWVRVNEHLEVIGPWQPKASLLDLNFSSLMFDRTVLSELGGWDDVRVNGDAEFRTRLLQKFGPDSICKTRYSQILSFSLSRDDSLTRSKATAVRSLLFGMRWLYRDAYEYGHERAQTLHNNALLKRERLFPLPLGIRTDKAKNTSYDMVVVSDFALKGGAFVSTLNYIIACCKLQKRVAVVHWRKFDLNIHSSLNPKLYAACLEYGIDILSPGDAVETVDVLFGYPAIINNLQDDFPSIKTQNLIVIINQFAERLYDGSDPQYDPEIVRANLRTLFGMEGSWIAISDLVRGLMLKDKRYPTPHVDVWSPMVEADEWFKVPLRWRGGSGAAPIIGRHGRDAYTKWPSDPDALRAAYAAGKPWPVRFLGGAANALKIIGEAPPNWQIMPFGSVEPQEFLGDLDFYLHYPHERYIEEFGRAVMEAMAMGIPVILPEIFRQTFGDGAAYAEPAAVTDVIQSLWSDKRAYINQAEQGRAFVCEKCDTKTFKRRLDSFQKSVSKVPAGNERRLST
jgi:glycosyltransferase involved in cell wall biosynthesis